MERNRSVPTSQLLAPSIRMQDFGGSFQTLPGIESKQRGVRGLRRNCRVSSISHPPPVGTTLSEGMYTKTKKLEEELALLQKLEHDFSAAGIRIGGNQDSGQKPINFNPVFDAFNALRYKMTAHTSLPPGFDNGIIRNVETSIMERFQAEKSTVLYTYKNGSLYAEGFEEPSSRMIIRGIATLLQKGSRTHCREVKELEGFLWIENYFKQAEENAIVIWLSPPVTGRYPDKVIHIAQKKRNRNTGAMSVELIRYTSENLSPQRYRHIAEKIDPHFFAQYKPGNTSTGEENDFLIDAYYLGKPLPVSPRYGKNQQEVFENLVGSGNTKSSEKIKDVLVRCKEIIGEYVRVVKDSLFTHPSDWIVLARTYQAILSFSESLFEATDTVKRSSHEGVSFLKKGKENLAEFVHFWSEQKVKEKEVGCGSSVNFEVLNSNSISNILLHMAFRWKNVIEGTFQKKKKTKQESTAEVTWSEGVCRDCKRKTLVGDCRICQSCVDLYYTYDAA